MARVIITDPDIKELVPGYLKNREAEIPELEAALASNALDVIRSTFHKVKGTAGGYGFPVMEELARQVESAALEKNLSQVQKCFEEYLAYLRNLQVVNE